MKHKGNKAKCKEKLLINNDGEEFTFKQNNRAKVMKTNFIAWYQRECLSFDDMDEIVGVG